MITDTLYLQTLDPTNYESPLAHSRARDRNQPTAGWLQFTQNVNLYHSVMITDTLYLQTLDPTNCESPLACIFPSESSKSAGCWLAAVYTECKSVSLGYDNTYTVFADFRPDELRESISLHIPEREFEIIYTECKSVSLGYDNRYTVFADFRPDELRESISLHIPEPEFEISRLLNVNLYHSAMITDTLYLQTLDPTNCESPLACTFPSQSSKSADCWLAAAYTEWKSVSLGYDNRYTVFADFRPDELLESISKFPSESSKSAGCWLAAVCTECKSVSLGYDNRYTVFTDFRPDELLESISTFPSESSKSAGCWLAAVCTESSNKQGGNVNRPPDLVTKPRRKTSARRNCKHALQSTFAEGVDLAFIEECILQTSTQKLLSAT
ncbi:hypothetical protein J6590_005200 [Homalodisca vitripennis]|nr:hypothetical protein J6590_005200 [Homalodisca vitripennis]